MSALVIVAAGLSSLAVCALPARAATTTTAAIDRYIRQFAPSVAAHKAAKTYANFAGDGQTYVSYPSEHAYSAALASFMSGPSAGGGSDVARVYKNAAGYTYVTFDPATHTSIAESEAALYDPSGTLVHLRATSRSYNGYSIVTRDAYFGSDGKAISDVTTRADYAPTDSAFAHPIKHHAVPASTIDLPTYPTLSKLPFEA